MHCSAGPNATNHHPAGLAFAIDHSRGTRLSFSLRAIPLRIMPGNQRRPIIESRILKPAALLLWTLACLSSQGAAQTTTSPAGQSNPIEKPSNVWVADNGDGTYKNPILHA